MHQIKNNFGILLIFTVNCSLLLLTSYFLPITSYLLPLTSYLLPLTSYLLPLTSYFLPLTSYFLLLTYYLLPITYLSNCYLISPLLLSFTSTSIIILIFENIFSQSGSNCSHILGWNFLI